MKTIAIINGPNLDRLGEREPTIYGNQSLKDLELLIEEAAKKLNIQVQFFQSNHEGVIIDTINNTLSKDSVDGLIINPGALTHTSLALRDSIAGANIPTIEVHISNIYQRESIRQHSMSAPACVGVISGLGFSGYVCALGYLKEIL
jgi:3-dehydroquinate dehydratase-2